ncbi:MAG: TrkH family potassium uptake protein [Bacteroidales bacterium]|jgi:trk system potassium uptake protein TrkH|nr:TrkH family potassium uptake protein [Bacteroidales bacterium]
MKFIRVSSVLNIVGIILIITSASFLLCIPVAILYSEPVTPFILSSITTLLPGSILFLLLRKSIEHKVSIKEGYISVTLGWLTLIFAGTLPYLYSGEIEGFVNILFETASGFTTTGASILSDVEALSKSILFWRSMTHWIGGIGIILLVIIILPTLKVGGYGLFTLESSLKEKILPKTKSIAKTVLLTYLSLTTAEIILLTAGGMDLFDSICHSFGSVATGGFSTRNTSLAEYSPYIQYVAAIFMFLAATSYVVFYYIVKGYFSKVKKNDEFWFYIFFVTASVVFVTLTLYFGTDRGFELSFRHAFFQVISQISCTGFATTDYTVWPHLGWFFMFLIMFAGGSTGSTTGGIKMARHLISLKNLKNTFVRLQHQNAVIPIRLNGRLVPDNLVNLMTVFISLYLFIFLIGAVIMQISGISIVESAGASATCMAGIGPGLGASGNMGNYDHFNPVAKVTMMMLMLIGRLEIFTILALFTRSFWKN